MSATALPRLVGVNHVALEVGDIEQALAFYGKIFRFTLRGRGQAQAFIDMGDQFLALMEVKAPQVLRAMQLDGTKSAKARQELADKGIGPE